jgi:hypothetical protein
VPDFAPRIGVEFIDPLGGSLMEITEHAGQIRRRVRFGGRMTDEVIMIRKNGPCFQLPAKIRRNSEQSPMQDRQSGFPLEMMPPQILSLCSGAWGQAILSALMD